MRIKWREKWDEQLLFAVAFGVFQLAMATNLSLSTFGANGTIQTISTALKVVAIGVAFFKFVRWDLMRILSEERGKLRLAALAALFLLLAAGYYFSRNILLLYAYVFLVAACGVPFRQIAKWALMMQLGMAALIIGSCLLGWIPDWTYERLDGTIRHSLGFTYPTHMATMLFFSACLFLMLRGEKLRLYEAGALLLLGWLVYEITDARTAFYMLVPLVALAWALKFYKPPLRMKSALGALLIASFALTAAACICLSVLYDAGNPVLEKINLQLSRRLMFAHQALEKYPLRPLGSAITWIGNGGQGYTAVYEGEVNFVDCSYVKILLEAGYVPFLLILAAYTAAMVRAVRNQDRYLCAMLLFVALYSAVEPRLMEIRFNAYIFPFAALYPFSGLKRTRKPAEPASPEQASPEQPLAEALIGGNASDVR